MAGHIKGQLESSELTTDQSDAVQRRLSACLASDVQHITPGQRGDHVKAIQQALEAIRKRQPELGLPEIDPDGSYGPETAAAVLKYKSAKQIFRPGQPIDNIVGRMTITEIDDDLARSKPAPPPQPVPPPKPVPPPEPPPPPPPIVGAAGIQIGPVGVRKHLITDYYIRCGLETVGPGQITVGGIQSFSTLEELIDILIARRELQQVVVSHGTSKDGLLLPYTKGTDINRTGMGIGYLSILADNEEKGNLDPSDYGVLNAAKFMKVKRDTVIRIVRKLVVLRKKRLVIHFRACNIGHNHGMLQDYKDAFGALVITAPRCRMAYVKINPLPPDRGSTIDLASRKPTKPRTRRRLFEDPIGLLWPLVIDIRDVDGHTKFDSTSFIDRPSPDQISGWATYMIRRWSTGAPQFIMPIMWDTDEIDEDKRRYYCPLEIGWRENLVTLPKLPSTAP